MTTEALTNVLAGRVLGWTIAPGRFLIGHRKWLPSWRFQPLERVEDAFKLMNAARPEEYVLGARNKCFRATVIIRGITGNAEEKSQAEAITMAVARAIGIEV